MFYLWLIGLVLAGLCCKLFIEKRIIVAQIVALRDDAKRFADEHGYEIKFSAEQLGKPFAELSQLVMDGIDLIRRNHQETDDNYRELQISKLALEEKYAQSYTLQLIQEQIGHELEIPKLLKKAVDILLGVFGVQGCAIYTVNEGQSFLELQTTSDNGELLDGDRCIPLDSDHVLARVYREGKIATDINLQGESLKESNGKIATEGKIIIPLRSRTHGLGIMVMENNSMRTVDKDLVDFVGTVANELSLSLDNAYLYDKMKQIANHDALTGVYNWMYLNNYVSELFSKDLKQISLAIFDLDFFKSVNDNYGHLVGDMVLQNIAQLAKAKVAEGVLARYGGEEFVIVMPEVTPEEAFEKIDNLRKIVADYRFVTDEGKTVRITISAGLASYPEFPGSLKKLLRAADSVLYKAKNSGRNKVCVAMNQGNDEVEIQE